MGYQYVLVAVFMFLNELMISLTTKLMPLQWGKNALTMAKKKS